MNRVLRLLLVLSVFCAPAARAAGDAIRGAKLFAGNCSMCHPQGGNVLAPEKELKGEKFLRQFSKDNLIFSTIRKGIPNSVMSPFPKERLSDDQVADIVAYVRTLTPPAKPPTAPNAASAPGKPAGKTAAAKCQPAAAKKVAGSASNEPRKSAH